ncbi:MULTISPECIES: hypothetical protein [unclassified Frankia]
MPDPDGPSRDALVWLVLWQARQNSQLKAIVEKLAAANADLTAANGVLAGRLGRGTPRPRTPRSLTPRLLPVAASMA